MKKAVIVLLLVFLSFFIIQASNAKDKNISGTQTEVSNLYKFCSDSDLVYFVDNGGSTKMSGRNDSIFVIPDSPYCKDLNATPNGATTA